MKAIKASYGEVRGCIGDADLLLFRRSGWIGRLIAGGGRSIYSHAAMSAWWGESLFCLEMRQFVGGRAVLLSNIVEQFPGRVDVYRTNPAGFSFQPGQAVEAMKRLTGTAYGWWAVIEAGILHTLLVRWILTPTTDDESNGTPPFCSMAVSRACRAGGQDPVPNLSDRFTEPGDLARSPFFQYRFTLVPGERP